MHIAHPMIVFCDIVVSTYIVTNKLAWYYTFDNSYYDHQRYNIRQV